MDFVVELSHIVHYIITYCMERIIDHEIKYPRNADLHCLPLNINETIVSIITELIFG